MVIQQLQITLKIIIDGAFGKKKLISYFDHKKFSNKQHFGLKICSNYFLIRFIPLKIELWQQKRQYLITEVWNIPNTLQYNSTIIQLPMFQKIEEAGQPIFYNYPQLKSPEHPYTNEDHSHEYNTVKIKVQEKAYNEILEKNQLLERRLRQIQRQNEVLKAQIKPKRKYVKKRPHPQKKIACLKCSAKYSSKMGLYLHIKKVPDHGPLPTTA